MLLQSAPPPPQNLRFFARDWGAVSMYLMQRLTPPADPGGEPWFVAADVCRALEIRNTTDALGKLDGGEKMTLDSTEGHSGQRGGAQSFNVVNEPGLYSLVLGSRKPK